MIGFGRMNAQRNAALQQQVNKAIDDCQLDTKDVNSLIDAAKKDGVVDQSEINTLNDVFIRSRPKKAGMFGGMAPGMGAMQAMGGMAGGMLGAPDADVDADAATHKQLGDFIARAQNDLAKSGQTDNNQMSSMMGQIRANTMPIRPYIPQGGPMVNGPFQNDPKQFRFDHAQMEAELTNSGKLCDVQDLAGVTSAEVNVPTKMGPLEHARVEVGIDNDDSRAPSRFTMSRIKSLLGPNVPFVTKLKQAPLQEVMGRAKGFGQPSLQDNIMQLKGVDHIAYKTDAQGFSKPVVVFDGRVPNESKIQLANMMHEAHLDFDMDLKGVFDCD